MDEKWLPIAGFPDYEVSNLGRVRSHKGFHGKPVRILKPWLNNHTGYQFVALHGQGGQRHRTVRSIVCEAFHGPRPTPKHEVAHGDGDKANCREDNLRWATSVENHEDSVRHGTHSFSTRFKPQLTDEQIREIRSLLDAGWTQSKIAAKFGIWQTHVSHIKLGRRRKGV